MKEKDKKKMFPFYKKFEGLFYDNVIKTNVLIPHQFFDTKQETTPKASSFLLYLASGFGYVVALAVFIALMVTESRNYVTETTIQTTDISDQTYSCSMASVVSKSVTYNSTNDFVSAAVFDQINELKPDCFANLQETLATCDSNKFYFDFHGSIEFPYSIYSTSSLYNGVFYGIMSVYASGIGYAARFDVSSASVQLSSTITWAYGDYPGSDTVAMNSVTNEGYFLRNDGSIYIFSTGKTLTCPQLLPFASSPGIIMDNQNSLYYYSYVSSNAIYIQLASQTTAGVTLACPGSYYHLFAIYQSNSNTPGVLQFYLQNSSEIIVIKSTAPSVSSPLFSGLSLVHNGRVILDYSGSFILFGQSILDITHRTIIQQVPIPQTLLEAGYSLDSSVLLSETDILIGLSKPGVIYTYYIFYRDTNTTEQLYSAYSGSRVGLFACGKNIISNVLPSDPNLLASYCPLNGILWTYTVTTATNTISPAIIPYSAARSISLSKAQQVCEKSNLVASICSTVGTLPPYLCTKKVFPSIFTVLSTAFADSHALLGILFLIFGILLPKMNKWLGVSDSDEDKKQKVAKVAPLPLPAEVVREEHDRDDLEASLNTEEFEEIMKKH